MLIKLRWFCFVVLLIGCVSAHGLSPASYDVNFESGLSDTFSFNVKPDYEGQEFEIYVEGDLAEYASVDKDYLKGAGNFLVNVDLPNYLANPGANYIFVGARDITQKEGGGFGIVANVRASIKVHVPYPGKYADVDFKIDDVNSGESANYWLKVYSRGDDSISVSPRIEILDSENNLVKSFPLDSKDIESGEDVELKSRIDVSDIDPGLYNAVARVSYSGGEKTAESDFRVGELFVRITNYTTVVQKKNIDRFFVEVESSWNDKIDNIYAECSVPGTDISFLTPSISLNRFEKRRLQGYFDTNELEGESVNLEISVNYEGKETKESIVVELIEKDFELNYVVVLIVLAIVLLVGFFVWIIMKMKKLEKKSVSGKK